MTTIVIYLLSLITLVVGWVIFYYVVKAAVRNGIIEAHDDTKKATYISQSKPEIPTNSEQIQLQKRYDKGEISFEVYQSEWNRMSSIKPN